MLNTQLLHPEILHALGQSGHGSQVLIADGNYPFNTGANPNAIHVYLNLRPGLIGTVDILETLVTAIPVEAACVMQPADGSVPPIFADYRRLLQGMELRPLERFDFYEAARGRDVALVIASGEQQLYANIVLTTGVVPPV